MARSPTPAGRVRLDEVGQRDPKLNANVAK